MQDVLLSSLILQHSNDNDALRPTPQLGPLQGVSGLSES